MTFTWASFYLICFVVGFAFSLFSFLLGGVHWHGVHLGHGPHSHGHVHSSNTISFFNPITLAAFLAWFGGTGYLLTRYSTFWIVTGFGLSTIVGLIGASIIFLFLTRVLMSKNENLIAADFEMAGVLGYVSVPIRADGTGEIIYSQGGTRRTCGARTDTGSAIPKQSEVIVTRYEKGIAYVRLWSEMAGEESNPADEKVNS